jgi:hypothetical protein
MSMTATDIQQHARRLLDVQGTRAIPEAAQKAKSYENSGETDLAQTWRRIEAALMHMRGPRES